MLNQKTLRSLSWRRFWARMFDYFLFGFIFMVLVANTFLPAAHPAYYFIAQTLFIITVEAVFLAQNNTTPGKKFLGLHVVGTQQRELSFATAWYRTFWAYVKGLWLGLPVIMFVPAWFNRKVYESSGTTIWDEAARTEIISYPSNLFRKIMFALIFLLIVFLIGNFALLQQGLSQLK
ncbi:MAG: RDD family protein [Acidaminococcaceae bacterium]